MEEKRVSKLQQVLKMSWESEQMPGWGDSLSVILEATKKEFQMKNKDAAQKNVEERPLMQENPIMEEDFSM